VADTLEMKYTPRLLILPNLVVVADQTVLYKENRLKKNENLK